MLGRVHGLPQRQIVLIVNRILFRGCTCLYLIRLAHHGHEQAQQLLSCYQLLPELQQVSN